MDDKIRPKKLVAADVELPRAGVGFVELAATSNYTFLTGASHPEELVEQAALLGHRAASIADRNTLAGVVRAHVAAKEAGIPIAIGCRLALMEPANANVVVYPTSVAAYTRLSGLLTAGKRRAPKGECYLRLDDLLGSREGLVAVAIPPGLRAGAGDEMDGFERMLARLVEGMGAERVTAALSLSYAARDRERAQRVARMAARAGAGCVASNDVVYHAPERRMLQDVLTCIRIGCTIHEAGLALEVNAERHHKAPEEMARLFADFPGVVERSVEIASRALGFNLDQLKYEYPSEECPAGMTPLEYLTERTWAGARVRYPEGVPDRVRRALEYELAMIAELKYEGYFLTCYEIVAFARSRNILCQGRGGAANSAVCYCLGITEVNPATFDLLFERFVSRERKEPPDIDIDFEHERREEVIQHIYEKYGRERAALTAEVISYRGRSAVREVGKAMGLSQDCVDAMAKHLDRWTEPPSETRVREAGLNPSDPGIRRVIELTGQLVGFPRHLSQHVGGFVITRGPLHALVPIENAAMEDRTVIEWDKDDIDAMGMLKIDVLGLGMLTCVRKGLEFLGVDTGRDGGTEARRGSDGATERRSDGGGRQEPKGGRDGIGPDVSRFDRVAEGDGAGTGRVSLDNGNAGGRALRADESDETGGDLDSFEHRGRAWAAEPVGLSSAPADRPRLARGVGYTGRAGNIDGDDPFRSDADRVAPRVRSDPASTDPEPGAQGQSDLTPASLTHAPSSLRRSVAPSLLYSVPPSLRPFLSHSLFPAHRAILASPTDPEVYAMTHRADTVGVFQIESRAQMSMLPRLKPSCFYDLVIEVAIVRPGPIQGGMVHPYLRRRDGKEAITYPTEEVRAVLGRTLGVPIFQEQAMKLAIVAAGFTPDQADALRRAMAAWKRKGDKIYRFGQQLIEGMIRNGYPREFAERCFEQIKGFSEYGFPESHAASFALLVYSSCWLKRYHPAAFAAALINSQPMGFYQPAQIIRDAREHGVEVREIDVNHSAWDCTLEWDNVRDAGPMREPSRWGQGGPAIRLGMRLVKGLARAEADLIRGAIERVGRLGSVDALWRRSGVSVRALRCLARADAFGSMGLNRQGALWQIRPLRDGRLPLFDGASSGMEDTDGLGALPAIAPEMQVMHDYAHTGLSLKAHPVSFVREQLSERGVIACTELRSPKACPQGRIVRVAGVVLVRQRPSTASGVVFITLEDETGIANLIIWSDTYERYRKVIRLSASLVVRGRVERQGEVVHVHADRFASLDERMPEYESHSRDFH
jgi:error-prone DNA polymerase